ncbi:MAG: ankyrin repeat domain-containing protein [Burkholderiaceae bacterium]|nr:ankyrin repeat domain-containing protein [Burkholderiaceae bacterium]
MLLKSLLGFVGANQPAAQTHRDAPPRGGASCLGCLAAAVLAGAIALAPVAAKADAYRDLFEAVQANDSDKVRLLMLRGLGTNSPDPKLGPAVVVAAQNKAFAALSALLESPLTNLNVFNAAGESALMYAAMFGELAVVRQLVARGAEVNHPGWTPLHYAATGGHRDVVVFLLDRHAYVDALSPNRTTPLMMAARQGHITVARLLVESGADPSLKNDSGLGAPEYLVRAGHPDEAKWMFERANEFLRRYGTKEEPVPASGSGRSN